MRENMIPAVPPTVEVEPVEAKTLNIMLDVLPEKPLRFPKGPACL